MDIDDLRDKLMEQGLSQDSMQSDPYKQFEEWFALVIDNQLPEPNAMCLATVDKAGQPWQRMVLLKTYDEDGFVFYTNYDSRKAGHVENNKQVCVLFPWYAIGRQVIVTGQARKIPAAESLSYFLTRSRGSQIGAWASPQSQVITSRSMLDIMYDNMKTRFHDGKIPLPPHWGGYRISPVTFEFWQSREHRLHDRFMYSRKQQGNWQIERLAP